MVGVHQTRNIGGQQLTVFIYSTDILHRRIRYHWKPNPHWFRRQRSLSVLRFQLLACTVPISRLMHLTQSQAHSTFEPATGSSRYDFLRLRILHWFLSGPSLLAQLANDGRLQILAGHRLWP